MSISKDKLKKVEFYGGETVSLLPFLIFIAISISIAILKAADVKGMWIAGMAGIMITFFLAKNKMDYAESIIEGMASKTAIVPIACWIFAGLFTAVLKSTGLVSGIIWLAYSLGAKGTVFVIVTFLASCLFATAAGTGFGTILAGMAVLYPAGVMLGANPVILAGAIISGASFGDNLAPVSDTAISSAASMEVDISGVVKTRFKYAMITAGLTIIVLIIFGKGNTVAEIPYDVIKTYMNPKGLIMLIPALLTIYIAVKKGDIIYATTIGTVVSIIFALLFGLITFDKLFFIKNNAVGGVLVNGISGMVDICILALLILACVRIMLVGGGDGKLLHYTGIFVKGVFGAELSSFILVSIMAGINGLTAPAILAVGTSYTNPLSKKYNMDPYRCANILAGGACTFAYCTPWTPGLLLASSMALEAHNQFSTIVPVLSPSEIAPWAIYAWGLMAVFMFSMITGLDRKKLKKNN